MKKSAFPTGAKGGTAAAAAILGIAIACHGAAAAHFARPEIGGPAVIPVGWDAGGFDRRFDSRSAGGFDRRFDTRSSSHSYDTSGFDRRFHDRTSPRGYAPDRGERKPSSNRRR